MAAQFVGSMVSIDCGAIGTYQGQLGSIDTATQVLTLVQAFLNGSKCQQPFITIAASDIKDLKIIRDADAARICKVSKNVHVQQLTDSTITSSATDCGNPPGQNQLVNGITSLHLSQNERHSPASGALTGAANLSEAKSKNQLTISSHKTEVSALPCDEVRKVAVNCSNGHLTGQSPVRRVNDAINDSECVRQQPTSKSNMSRAKNVQNLSPINGLNASSHQQGASGMGAYRRNDYGMMNIDSDHRLAVRKRTTSASDACTLHKNGFRGNSNKYPERHGLVNGCLREDDCFSMPVNSSDEFDFEKNLAMFDKRAVFDEIERDLGQSGMHVPTKPSCNISSNPRTGDMKYRCDENVLPTHKASYRQITVTGNGDSASREFVTDSGLVVPSVLPELRRRLFELGEHIGYSSQRRIEMVGRSAAEMVLQLLGGGSRFDPKNSHQRPRVTVLCGQGHQSAIAINCVRHLVSRNIFVTLFMPDSVPLTDEMTSELKLIEFGSYAVKVSSCRDLPKKPVDMIISAMDNHDAKFIKSAHWYLAAVEWANQNKASVLAIDPPVERIGVMAKWSLAVALPFAYDESCGQIYLCDLGLPQKMFRDAGLTAYYSPFAHKFVIPLHQSN